MTEDEFRILHSKLIEQCIYLEDILRRYFCLVVSKNKFEEYLVHLDKVDDNTMGQLINCYKNSNADFSFPSDFIEKIEEAKDIRNFYAHNVFYKRVPIRHGVVQNVDAERLKKSYNKLIMLYDDFAEIYDKKYEELKSLEKNNDGKYRKV